MGFTIRRSCRENYCRRTSARADWVSATEGGEDRARLSRSEDCLGLKESPAAVPGFLPLRVPPPSPRESHCAGNRLTRATKWHDVQLNLSCSNNIVGYTE